jgi:hypothetical protein
MCGRVSNTAVLLGMQEEWPRTRISLQKEVEGLTVKLARAQELERRKQSTFARRHDEMVRSVAAPSSLFTLLCAHKLLLRHFQNFGKESTAC